MASRVTGLVEDRGRVAGVRVAQNGSEATLQARLVVGADGRNSTIASLVGARKYNLTPNERFIYWSFFEGVEPDSDPAFVFHRWDDRIVIATHADSGLYQVMLIPDLRDLPRFREDLEGSFMVYTRKLPAGGAGTAGRAPGGQVLRDAALGGVLPRGSGPGWVLVGDAGHFKDPTPGQGIQDAFRQVDALVPAIATALDGCGEDIDSGMAAWGCWRDKDAAEHYWLATDMGKAGPMPAVVPKIERRLLEQGKIGTFLDLFYTHRSRPSQVFTPSRVVGATGRLLARRRCKRRALLSEVGTLLVEDFRRKRLNRQPVYAAAGTALDAGAFDVDDSVLQTAA